MAERSVVGGGGPGRVEKGRVGAGRVRAGLNCVGCGETWQNRVGKTCVAGGRGAGRDLAWGGAEHGGTG